MSCQCPEHDLNPRLHCSNSVITFSRHTARLFESAKLEFACCAGQTVKCIDCRPKVGTKWPVGRKGTYNFFQTCHYIYTKLRVLDYIHIRKGPNKVRLVGIFKPFRDARGPR